MRISVNDLDVRYGARHAVAGVSLAAEPGEMLGLIGANGSGKSSILKAIVGLQPHGGTITFSGGPRPARLGYMPQDIGGRSALTVLETVLLGRLGRLGLKVAHEDIVAVSAVLDELDLTALAPRRLSELSGGQRQLVYLAQALAGDPPVLLLDEPISALDIRHQLDVLETVRRLTVARKLSTLIVLHDLNAAARFCDRLGLMSGGSILVAGSPAQVLTPVHLAKAFHIDATVMIDAEGYPVVTARRSLSSLPVPTVRT